MQPTTKHRQSPRVWSAGLLLFAASTAIAASPEHQEQVTQRQGACLDVAHTDDEDGCGPDRGDQTDEQTQSPFGEDRTETGPHAFAGVVDEAPLFTVLLSKGLHDADGRQRLLHHRHGGALEPVQRQDQEGGQAAS